MADISYNNPGTQGTGRGGAYLAQWLMEKNARENQITNAGKAAEYLRKSFGDNAEQESAIDDAHWANMSNQDKAAWAAGYQDKQAAARMQAITAATTLDSQAKAEDLRSQAAQRLRDSNDTNVFASVMKSYGGQPVAGTSMNDDDTPAAGGSPYGNLPTDPQQVIGALMAAGMSPYGLAKYGQTIKDITTNGQSENTPKVSMLDAGDHKIPVVTMNKTMQIDPAYGLNLKQQNAVDLLDQRQGTLAPADALRAYNSNQARVAQLNQMLTLAKDPKNAASGLDPDALSAELDDLKAQQATLKPIWSGGAGKRSVAAPAVTTPTATPAPAPATGASPATQVIPASYIQYLQANPDSWKSFEAKYGAGSSAQYLP